MSDEQIVAPLGEQKTAWYKARLPLFIAGSIGIALLLVLVSMALYLSSGAAQLDLSRPGYQSVQNQVEKTETFKGFPATGSIDEKALDQFQKLFDEQAKQVTTVDAFNPEVLSDQALGIDAPAAGM